MAQQLEALDLPIPILLFGPGMCIRWISQAAVRELGVRLERLVGRSWYDVSPESAACAPQHKELFAGSRDSLDLARIPLPVGCATPRYISLRMRPLHAADGSVEAVLATGEDVTGQVQAEVTLRDSERRLEVALWSSKAAYWTIDVAEDRADMSPQFFELTGIAEADWRTEAHPWNSRMHVDDRPRARRIYEDFIAGRIDLYECEYRLRCPGGWLWLHDRGRIVERDHAGQALLVAGTSQDATERKSLELALASAAERGQYRLSQDLHDGLGQELSGIQYLLSAVTTRLRRRNDPEAEELEQVLALVRSAMSSTRLVAHGLAGAILQPGGLKSALVGLSTEVSKSYGIRVTCSWDDEMSADLTDAIAQNLFRISQEALSNARRHGGATEVALRMRQQEGFFELIIDDNGDGMPVPRPEGPGIGLKIMAYRAQTIGATLTIEPRQPRGTHVLVRFPQEGDRSPFIQR